MVGRYSCAFSSVSDPYWSQYRSGSSADQALDLDQDFFMTNMKDMLFQKVKLLFSVEIWCKDIDWGIQHPSKNYQTFCKTVNADFHFKFKFSPFLDTILTVLDPEPYSQYLSGSRGAITCTIRIHRDPDPKHCFE